MEKTLSGLQQMLKTAGADIQRQLESKSRPWTFSETAKGFVHAVDWTEPLLLGIAGWHLLMLGLAVATRHHTWTHAALFTCLCGQVLAAEQLNLLGARHWKDFASQDYFDKQGVFISVVMSLPTVLLLLGMLINMVRTAGDLLVQAKVAELKAKQRSQSQGSSPGEQSALPNKKGSGSKAKRRHK